jgi:hypothetical protein
MRVGDQRQQTLLVTTELVIWHYANAFIFTNQSELDFGIAYVLTKCTVQEAKSPLKNLVSSAARRDLLPWGKGLMYPFSISVVAHGEMQWFFLKSKSLSVHISPL